MTSTVAAELSPDWTGLDNEFAFDFPPRRQAEHCASSGLEREKRSKETPLLGVAAGPTALCLPQAIMTIVREASIYGGIRLLHD